MNLIIPAYNETWEKTINIHSRVMNLDNDFVTCECLIDKEMSIFETRIFPSCLFSHIKNLGVHSYILLSIKSTPGATRIDVYDGSQLVDKRYFEIKDEWENMADFMVPVTKPIKL